MSGDNSKNADKKTFLNNHNAFLIFGIIFLILAFLGLLALSGAQTGSSTTSGIGSLVISSTGGQVNGEVNPTAEVVGEFLIVLLLILGVMMITYVYTIKKAATKLVDANQLYAAVVINGNNSISSEQGKKLKKEEVQNLILDLGLPSNTIPLGIAASKNAAKATSNAVTGTYNKLKTMYNMKAGAPTEDKDEDENVDEDENADEN